jgi:Ca2+-binding EF-hand superfamily protein
MTLRCCLADRQTRRQGDKETGRANRSAVSLLLLLLVVLSACLLVCLSPCLALPAAEPAKEDDVHEFVFLGEARPVLVRLHVRVAGKPVQAAWDDFMKYLFGYLDVNGDGVLDGTEAERVPSVQQVLGGALGGFGGGGGGRGGRGGDSGAPKLADLDTDGNGKVTPAELAAWYRKNGFVPFQYRLDPPAANPVGMAAAFLGGPGPEPSVHEVGKAIFNLLDKNKDDQLSKEELAAAEAVLLKLDENDDEIVSTRELVPNNSNSITALAGMFAMGRQGKIDPTPDSSTLVPVLTPGTVPVNLAKRLQERYAKGGLIEFAGVTRQEIGLDEAEFAKLDKNKDGRLDVAELGGFAKRTPDLELVIRLGMPEADKPRVELLTGEGRSPLAGKVAVREAVALLDLGVTRAELRSREEAERADPFGGFIRPQLMAQFRQADTDGNGHLDAQEAEKSRTFRPLFKLADRDGDGKLTEKEVNAYLDHLQERQQRATAACVTLELSDQSRGLFDLLDTNRDGRLSVRELRQGPKLLAQYDRGGKGYLVRGDIPHTWQLALKRGAAGGDADPRRAFFALYSATSYQSGPEAQTRGPLWFRKMDRNRDGDVSRREFLFGEEEFRRIDTDGDGLISVEEAEAFDARSRQRQNPKP